jgi:hypothetical protein
VVNVKVYRRPNRSSPFKFFFGIFVELKIEFLLIKKNYCMKSKTDYDTYQNHSGPSCIEHAGPQKIFESILIELHVGIGNSPYQFLKKNKNIIELNSPTNSTSCQQRIKITSCFRRLPITTNLPFEDHRSFPWLDAKQFIEVVNVFRQTFNISMK